MQLSVIDMEPCHVGRVADLEREVFTSPWNEKMLLDTLLGGTSLFLVGVESDLVGYVGSVTAGDEVSITNVAVFPEHRKKGVGEALVRELIRRAKDLNFSKIFLEVRVSNAPAISLYEKIGFEIKGTRKNFYTLPREDAFVMTYEIK